MPRSSKPRRRFKSPVRWLFGRNLIRSLKGTLLYATAGNKIDPKHWMKPELIDLRPAGEGKDSEENGEYWFDYLADTGDGQKPVYDIAYLCQSNLWLSEDGNVQLESAEGTSAQLPRGQFLLIGGDTAYHVADYETLAVRLQQPFGWAYDDLVQEGKIDPDAPRRPLFGIPGNHDYYDSLDGFHRQFRKPFNAESEPQHAYPPGSPLPQLTLRGFRRIQETSFFALKLPDDWVLFGLDTQRGKIDTRQLAFFSQIVEQERTYKLIVATPEPTTVFGQYAKPDSRIAQTFLKLGLERPFLSPPEQLPPDQLAPERCRLDLSGDVHHYARYWGHDPGSGDEPEPCENYASVVSGLGGAFLHPSQTDFGDVTPNRLFPAKEDSHKEVTKRLLRPWKILAGGFLGLIGGLIAMLIVFGLTVPDSSRTFFPAVAEMTGVRLVKQERPEVCSDSVLSELESRLSLNKGTGSLINREWLFPIGVLLVMVPTILHVRAECQRASTEVVKAGSYSSVYLLPVTVALAVAWAIQKSTYYKELHPFVLSLLVVAFVALGVITLFLARKYDDAVFAQARKRVINRLDSLPMWILVILGLMWICFGTFRYGVHQLSTVFVDVAVLTAMLIVVLGLPAFAVIVGAARQRFLGRSFFLLLGGWHATLQLLVPVILAMYVPWALALLLVVVATAVSLLCGMCSQLFLTISDKLIPYCIKFIHWMTDLPTPPRKKTFRLWLSGVVKKAAIVLHGPDIPRNDDEWKQALQYRLVGALLLVVWAVLGVFLLTVPFMFKVAEPQEMTICRLLWTFALGMASSCLWFGWYVAVSVPFNGHNNEAGGGCRIEKYKQFIRIRLRENTLTGFVIGFDEPREHGSELELKLIDHFEIRATPSRAGSPTKAPAEAESGPSLQ